MERKDYNGWTNYETWAVNLWLTNDQGSDAMIRELVAEGQDYEAAERLKDLIGGEMFPLKTPSMFSDLLTAAISEVNWIEIVKAFREE